MLTAIWHRVAIMRRKIRILKIIDEQLVIAEQLITRHTEAINLLHVAMSDLRALATIADAWSADRTKKLTELTLIVRDGNWRQYG
jgi:hypothetical protein